MLTPNEILEKMELLANDYETARQYLAKNEPLFDALVDDCLVWIQAQKFSEFTSADNREALENAMISKLTIAEKDAIARGENPKLADDVKRAQKLLKRIEQQFNMWQNQLSYHQTAMKQERAVGVHRP